MTNKSDGPLLKPKIVKLTDWQSITQALHEFPPPALTFDEDGDSSENAWAFRGVGNAKFALAPSIERNAVGTALGWPALEIKVSEDFRSRANLYLPPPLEGELVWLALMQHYGVPTRLLDFTLSPFVALYFAVKPFVPPSDKETPEFARVWALDSNAIYRRSLRSIARARMAERERSERKHGGRVSSSPDDAASDRDVLKGAAEIRRRVAEDVLAATGTFRSELGRQGCVCVAMPPSSNSRLASQQGLFLFNGAEHLVFEQSLVEMMGSAGHERWCRAFDIPVGLLPEIETRLFQMNIHEQSLFPDIAGLAGLIKQRIRLHWSTVV
jgi:hypothetical protein